MKNKIFGFLFGQPLSYIFGIHKLLMLAANLSTVSERNIDTVEKAMAQQFKDRYNELEILTEDQRKIKLNRLDNELDIIVLEKAKEMLFESKEMAFFYGTIVKSKLLFFIGGFILSTLLTLLITFA